MMMPAVWCSARSRPGRQEKSGNSDSATFMRNVPEPLRYEAGPLNGIEGARYLYKEVLAALSSPTPVV